MNRKMSYTEKNAFLAKWIGYLFFMVIPATLCGIIFNKTLFPKMADVGNVVDMIITLIYCAILLVMSKAGKGYLISAICTAVAVVINYVTGMGDNLVFLAIISVPLGFAGEYFEYTTHAELLYGVDSVLAEKWKNLWKWYIGLFAATVGCLLVMAIVPLLGLFLIMAVAIGLAVISVLKIVYLYKTSKAFDEYKTEENSADIQNV